MIAYLGTMAARYHLGEILTHETRRLPLNAVARARRAQLGVVLTHDTEFLGGKDFRGCPASSAKLTIC